MEAVARRPLHVLSRRRALNLIVVGLSCALTAFMSYLFHREIRPDMMATGFVAAVVINYVVDRMTRIYRQRLREAHALLERRVRERTVDLQTTNAALRTALDEQVRLREEQVKLRDELMVRDRMATAGMVAAGVSHEIRSPLGVIVLLLEELREHLGDKAPPSQHAVLDDLASAAEHITTIVRDLSSVARPVDDPLGPTVLREVVDSAVRLASYRLGKGATLERGVIDVPPVVGNASRLVQLVMNLLANAARASRPDVLNCLRVCARVEAERVALVIADTGTGMSPDTLARIWEPFFTTGRHTGGTGLGLPICRSIVERMGGDIEIASELGVGTTVTVWLRRADAA